MKDAFHKSRIPLKRHIKAVGVPAWQTLLASLGFLVVAFFLITGLMPITGRKVHYSTGMPIEHKSIIDTLVPSVPALDVADYDFRMRALALGTSTSALRSYDVHEEARLRASTTTATSTSAKKPSLWPTKAPRPKVGALIPFNRIVAYYGNFYSKQMGVLGQYPEDEMLDKLRAEVAKWQAADPDTPVIPALHYIAVTAQASAGKDGKYRLRMPDAQIDKTVEMAKKVNGIVFIDIQVGKSTIQSELPLLETYLKMPNVHLGIDPEFYMKDGSPPGRVIGTMDANEINYAAEYLAKLVRDNDLPPKILVIHRFTEDMVTGYKRIAPLPEVQVVIEMDGWGSQARKINTYKRTIASEPVQFTGFKLFYKNDFNEKGSRILRPDEVLELVPRPIYIQYQ
jgi:hypothetical protein